MDLTHLLECVDAPYKSSGGSFIVVRNFYIRTAKIDSTLSRQRRLRSIKNCQGIPIGFCYFVELIACRLAFAALHLCEC